MRVHLSMFMPLVGGIYGAFLGGYIHGGHKSRGGKLALIVGGVFVVLLCLVVFVIDFGAD